MLELLGIFSMCVSRINCYYVIIVELKKDIFFHSFPIMKSTEINHMFLFHLFQRCRLRLFTNPFVCLNYEDCFCFFLFYSIAISNSFAFHLLGS